MRIFDRARSAAAAAMCALLAVTALAYLPGLSGPFRFDDTTNILQNPLLRIDSLQPTELWRAAWSLESGPLKRPVAYLSFALDYYAAGGYAAIRFKTTNLLIHLLNTLLVAALALRLGRAAFPDCAAARGRMALLAAALFALHPLALSPVLYVVQRMASLSTLFVLAALLCMLQAREALASAGKATLSRHAGTATAWVAAGSLLALLGLFTKENAALLPLLYLLADRVLYPDACYWRWLRRPGPGGRLTRIALYAAIAAGVWLLAWKLAPGYASRPFSLLERQLTEARVLWFYLSLYALPRINAFGLYHDDIALSTGLFTPWTTLPAVLGIVALIWLGFRVLRSAPLAGFAILWFFAGHLMESTLVPLEIAHEHRNYLPLVGLTIGSAWLLMRAGKFLPPRRALGGALAVLGLLGGITALRAWEWGETNRFAHFQVAHHPRSAHSRNDYASELGKQRRFADALEELREAQRAAPHEAGYYFNYALTARTANLPIPAEIQAEFLALLQSRPLSAFGLRTLQNLGDCLPRVCAYMAPDMIGWIQAHLSAPVAFQDESQLHHLLGLAYRRQGETQNALNAFERAHALDPKFLHPMFEQANIFLALGQWDNATFNLQRIRAANEKTWVRRDREIAQLADAIAQGRTKAGASAP